MTSEYQHLFTDLTVITKGAMSNEGEAAGLDDPKNLGEGFWLMSALQVPESKINMSHIWIHESDEEAYWVNPHVHDYDEILIWTGSNPDDPRDLGAEIYMEIEGERHIITTSGSVYIPAGTVHCPLGWNKVTRPFRFSALSLAPTYK
ncbi:hypothetical protein JSO19_07860 [Leucobacter sp. UCMA 4100]|uniref:hypothetical protein n=1 Tax=Leucobacter sp. UCMA 4100 TaxID=2810534 RepID=UPI0022EAF349|nr:hypothetical protein [Leucobacter sp. UCMA 4100]MDA3147294.1 hypothetical protein [Leucobacter sp. UCMA 4100]